MYSHFKEVFQERSTEKVTPKREEIDEKSFQRTQILTVNRGYLKIINNDAMPGMLELVRIVLTISPSTAEYERAFSGLNLIVTNMRTRWSEENKGSHLRMYCNGPSLVDFEVDLYTDH